MIGQILGHYRIVEKIGAGGMGVVYRAHDERLDRDVALKVLPAGALADEAARKRFRKEALALAKLSHPNIGAIHDFDTQDGEDFLVMEHIAGGTLANRLAGGALREKEVAALGAQIAAALAEAHEQGIVHRDLKPGNIAVTTKEQVKVLDFGLAKLLPPAGGGVPGESVTESLTAAQVVGTLPYMAPEQVEGERLDARTDIYGLGVVLYEMATGVRPFRADSALRLRDAILHQPPVLPSRLNPQVSPALEGIILKCLEKDPENRYQSAKEAGVDLRRLGAPSTAPTGRAAAPARASWRWPVLAGIGVVLAAGMAIGLNVGAWRERLLPGSRPGRIESLAVLPLENLSGDPSQSYFADGMTEELTAEMTRVRVLRVISRTSAMQYRQTNKSMAQVSRELGVDALIEGSVLRSGNRVRITTQLIHGPTDTHLWAESYERDLRDVITLQREVARAVAQQIRVALAPQDQTRLTSVSPVNSEAHEAYLLGRYHLNRATTEKEIHQAIAYFNQAIEKDPGFAPVYAGIADAYTQLRSTYFAPHEVMPKAKAAAVKAIQLDEGLAEAHVSLGGVLMFYDFDWPAAENELQRALELNPSLAQAHDYQALYLAAMKQPQQSVVEIERALKLDPLSLPLMLDAGWVYYLASDYDKAIEVSLKAIDLDSKFWGAYTNLGLGYEKKGRFTEAIAVLEKARQFDDSVTTLEMLGGTYAAAGHPDKANAVAAELAERSKHRYVCPYEIATIYAGLGNKKSALQWLRRAVDDRADCAPWMSPDPKMDSLRSDPRFQDLLRRIGLP